MSLTPYAVFGSGQVPLQGLASIITPSVINLEYRSAFFQTAGFSRGFSLSSPGMYCGPDTGTADDVLFITRVNTPFCISALFGPGGYVEGILPMGIEVAGVSGHTYTLNFTGDEFSFGVSDSSGFTEIETVGVDYGDEENPNFTLRYYVSAGYTLDAFSALGKDNFMRIYVNGQRYPTTVTGGPNAATDVVNETATATISGPEENQCIGDVNICAGSLDNAKAWNLFNNFLRTPPRKNWSQGVSGLDAPLCGSPSYFYYVSGITHVPIMFGASVSDPHFIGFRGEKFFFNGKPDKYYNLLSDSNIQVNAYFRHWESSGEENFTATQKIGVIIGNNELTRIEFNSSRKVLVNGIRLGETPDETVYFKTGNGDHQGSMTVKFKGLEDLYDKLGHEEFGKPLKAYVLDVESYELHIIMATDESTVNRPYLNFVGQLKSTKVRPHGIVGQTADFSETREAVEGGIQGEGII